MDGWSERSVDGWKEKETNYSERMKYDKIRIQKERRDVERWQRNYNKRRKRRDKCREEEEEEDEEARDERRKEVSSVNQCSFPVSLRSVF